MENVKDKTLAMNNFFAAYSSDIGGSLSDMSRQELLEHLGSYQDGDVEDVGSYTPDDIFVGVVSAATDIPEEEFLKHSLKYFGHEK
nr:hypothetical protein [uncultured Halomonas sp.]